MMKNKASDKDDRQWKEIEYLILDVDGTLTDGGIIYDDNGNELKRFSIMDGMGFKIAHAAGIGIVVMTGRECKATCRRMEELQADYLFQNVKNKSLLLKEFMNNNYLKKGNMAYMGDDINDYGAMLLCGLIGCPGNAAAEVKEIADYVSAVKGGNGAMRDFVEYILSQRGDKDEIIQRVINTF